MRPIFIFISGLIALAAVTGALFFSGKIGHKSIPWQDFRTNFASNEYREVRFHGQKVTAFSRNPDVQPLVVYTPTDPMPVVERNWFIVKAVKHGVKLVFEAADPTVPNEEYD